MAIENVQQLLMEQLGKNGGTEIFTTAAQTSKDWYLNLSLLIKFQ